jgi:hypothetical protein
MRRIILALLSAVLFVPVLGASALPEPVAVAAGVEYIRTTQQDDGGFGGAFGVGQSLDAIYALRAAGIDPTTVVSATGNTPADFLIANAPAIDSPGTAAKAALAALAMGMDPHDAGGIDLVALVDAAYDPDTGRYDASDFSQAVVVAALEAIGESVPPEATGALRATQADDGGWGFDGTGDPDTTAIVLQALVAAGVSADDADVAEALAYFDTTQTAEGGWGFGGDANASSTAYIIQALLAAGEDPEGAAYTVATGANPVTYLLSQQQADGSFTGFDAAFATNLAVPALAGHTFANAPSAPITEPEPTQTPAAAGTPAPAPPAPPSTGTGLAGDGGSTLASVLAVLGGAVALAGAGAAAAARQRSARARINRA